MFFSKNSLQFQFSHSYCLKDGIGHVWLLSKFDLVHRETRGMSLLLTVPHTRPVRAPTSTRVHTDFAPAWLFRFFHVLTLQPSVVLLHTSLHCVCSLFIPTRDHSSYHPLFFCLFACFSFSSSSGSLFSRFVLFCFLLFPRLLHLSNYVFLSPCVTY